MGVLVCEVLGFHLLINFAQTAFICQAFNSSLSVRYRYSCQIAGASSYHLLYNTLPTPDLV